MLAAGKLRVLSAGDPEPYPDSIRVDLDDQPDDEGEEAISIGKAGRKRRQGKTAIQKAIEKTR
jgi:hypothetical protein